MQQTKLISLLSQLSTRERTRFGEYVNSPFFNKHQKRIELTEILLEMAPVFASKKLQKKDIFRKLYGPIAYDELMLNNLISDVLHLLYNYLAQCQYDEQPILNKQYTLGALHQRGIYDHTPKLQRRYEQLLKKTPYRNHEFFGTAYHFYDQLDQYFLSQAAKEFATGLQKKNDQFDLYYFANKLRMACDMISRNQVSKAGYECHLIEELIFYYKKNNDVIHQYAALKVYYQILEMFNHPEKTDFYQQAKTDLEQQHRAFPQEELRIIYVYLQNYCVQKINKGQSEYYKELQALYKILLREKIILRNGFLTERAYKNIITVGIRIRDFAWTEAIIHEHKKDLLPKKRDNAVAYNLAAFYYAQKEYKKALQQLHDVVFTDDAFYHLGAKIIQLKSFYELNETEPLFSLIEAFKKYISRNRKMAEYHKLTNQNFLKLTKKIYQLKIRRSQLSKKVFLRKYNDLTTILKNQQPIANKDWLEGILEKMTER